MGEVIRIQKSGGGPCADGTVENSDLSYSDTVASGGTLVLPDINHVDPQGNNVPTPGQTIFDSTTFKSGISYPNIPVTGEITNYRTGADGYNLINGIYQRTNPVYPVSYARLDYDHATPFFKLEDNNSFGNKDRFTDDGGLQTYANDYVIDHLYDLGWKRTNEVAATWNNAIDNGQSASYLTFNNWRVASMSEYYTILNRENGANWLDYAPFNHNSSVRKWSSTTDSNVTTNAMMWQRRQFSIRAKTLSDPISFLVRNHS